MVLFIDANIFFSAFHSPAGTVSRALSEAKRRGDRLITSQYVLREMSNAFEKKFPTRVLRFQLFMQKEQAKGLRIVETPEVELPDEEKIRDAADRPILRAAIAAKAEILLTGDKDFLESGIETPKIMTAAEYLELVSSE